MISEKASTALGTIATVCWCVQLIPQIIYNWKRKDCTGLPPLMMFSWVVSCIPFGIYFCISAPNMILQIQPHLFMFFCSISFIQTLYYPPLKMNRLKIILTILSIILFDVGMEVGFIIWLKPLYAKGITWPNLIFGILATILLSVGLLPPYFELAKRQGRVVGINFWFLSVDSLGAWLSIASVILGNMDVMGIILYCAVAALELGIFLSHFIWCCRFKWFGNSQTIDETERDDLSIVNDEEDGDIKRESIRFDHFANNEDVYKDDTNFKGSKYNVCDTVHDSGDNRDKDEDYSSIFEDHELNELYHQNKSSVHAVHGVILQGSSGSTGCIKI